MSWNIRTKDGNRRTRIGTASMVQKLEQMKARNVEIHKIECIDILQVAAMFKTQFAPDEVSTKQKHVITSSCIGTSAAMMHNLNHRLIRLY